MADEDVSREEQDADESAPLDGDSTPGFESDDAPPAEADEDPGLTARLRALSPEDEHRPADAPLWAFERSGPDEAAADEQPTGETTEETADQTAKGTAEDQAEVPDAQSATPSADSDASGKVAAAAVGLVGAAALADELADGVEEPTGEPSGSAASGPSGGTPDGEAEPPAEPTETDSEAVTAPAEAEPEPESESGLAESESDAETEHMEESSGTVDEESADASDQEATASPDDTAAAAALAASTVPSAGETGIPEPREIDLGPEGHSKWWILAVVIVVAVAVLGAGAYAWWWTTSRPIPVPEIIGKQPAEAVSVLYEAGLTLGKVSEVPTDAAPVGTVVSQIPEEGSSLKPGEAVAFSVAAEPDQSRVPDVSGQSLEDAEQTLAEARLSSYVVRSYSATAPVDTVFAQLPVAGSQLPPGAVVAVVSSRGPAPATVVVPKVQGLSESEAVRLIQASNLKAAVYRSVNASVTSGDVMNQSPAARTSVPLQSTVQILVSQGAGVAPVTVPNVVGLSKSSATKKLQSAKLKVSTRTVPSSTVAKGNVISQMPGAGTKTASGATVGLLVSAGNLPTVAVPSVIGTDSAGAKKALQSAGLTPVVLEVEVAEFAAGKVFSQFPAAGQQYQRYFPAIALVAKVPEP